MAEHPVKLFLDTSVYIPFINHGIAHPAIELPQGPPLIYMSAVVMEELYAGALDSSSIKLLDKMLIAATARKIGGAVVTNNLKDFQRIQEYIDFRLYKG